MPETTAFYIHGLGHVNLQKSARAVLERNKRRGIDFRVAQFDWQHPISFIDLLDSVTKQAFEVLNELSDEATLVLEGSSAGGSLAFNLAQRLDDPRVRAVSHSGRLTVGKYAAWDPRNLNKAAHLGTQRASQTFYDSVAHFESIVGPSLNKEDKERMLITKPWADEVVPISTMTIEGIRTVTVPMIGHGAGIGVGVLRLPSLLEL